jgi:protein O-GlcNAc transferase
VSRDAALPRHGRHKSVSDTAFSDALRHHEAGRIGEARAIYQDILAHDPDHADSLHLLGLITAQEGNPAAGAALIQRAIAHAPGRAPFHNNLALAYRLLGRGADAVIEYRTAVALRPDSAEIHNNLATTLHELGRGEEALIHYRRAAEHAPGTAEIWYNLANALSEREPPSDVETCFRRAIALKPNYTDAHANYGRWLLTQARWAEAEARLGEAARLDPACAATWDNLGIALQERGRMEEAQACYQKALALAPELAGAHYNLGCLLLGQGHADEAAACQEAAIAADPHYGAARLAYCMAQLPILYRTDAEIALRRRRYASALDDLAGALESSAAVRSLSAAIGTVQPFFLPYQGENDRELQETYGRLACRVLAETHPAAPLASRPLPGERIRLGIVSGYFCDHTLFKLFLEGWLTQLDRSRFEVIGFHTGRTADAQTEQAAGWCDRFVWGMRSATAWRETICNAAPHVLLYPEVGMDPITGRLAAMRLAPVQCVTWGQPETTGFPTVDYFLSSELMEPLDGDAHYTERLIRLPHLGLCYLPDERSALRLERAELGLHPTAPVYWSGQALYKYLPQYDEVFPRIAAAVGACQFVFIGFAKSADVTAAFRERLGCAFAAMGLDADRYCVFLPPMSQDRFITAVGLADVILDTPGWSGGKSTMDCLVQDPAIVTLPGRFMRGRHTAAILRRIGCEATVAASLDEYVAIAARLGRDADWRAEVRHAVAQRKPRAFADVAYMRGLEAFLLDAIERV